MVNAFVCPIAVSIDARDGGCRRLTLQVNMCFCVLHTTTRLTRCRGAQLRFAMPEPPVAWAGVRDVYPLANMCAFVVSTALAFAHGAATTDAQPRPRRCPQLKVIDGIFVGAEDCLCVCMCACVRGWLYGFSFVCVVRGARVVSRSCSCTGMGAFLLRYSADIPAKENSVVLESMCASLVMRMNPLRGCKIVP